MSDVELDYEYLSQRALRRVVHDVLELAAELGTTPGEHHFYIEFATQAPGVGMPDDLRADYPSRMTIVIQHQFENLIVREDEFAVTLWFKGAAARLTVPFEAVTNFGDPSVGFGLRFAEAAKDAVEAPSGATNPERGEVVSLDKFRKK